MRFFIYLFILVLSLTKVFSQQFSSTASGSIGGSYAYLANGIPVANLGSLDGLSLGVTQLEITMSASGAFGSSASILLYLAAPNGLAMLVSINTFKVSNGTYTFNLNPNSKSIKYLADPAPGTYFPYGNFNSLNLGQTANGTWKLYAIQKNFGATVTISNWKLTFGNQNLSSGEPNQSFATSLPLINTTTTGNFISSSDIFHGIQIGDSKGYEVGSSQPLTERTSWYSFKPKCKNDRIEITGTYGYINSSILNSARTIVKNGNDILNGTYTYPITDYLPGNTYYLVMDSDEADTNYYQVKWFEGDLGCLLPTSITTLDEPVAQYCQLSSIGINYNIVGTFNSGNRFTAQLSDTNFSFSNPTVLGFVDGMAATPIQGTLPAGLKTGKSYKIRVVSSDPATIGSVNSSITILGTPKTPANIIGKNPVCSSESGVNFSVLKDIETAGFMWKINNGSQISTSNNDSSQITVNFGTIASQLSVQAYNSCGTSSPFLKPIDIVSASNPSVVIQADTNTICQGDSVKFTSKTTNRGLNQVYDWRINNNTLNTNQPNILIKNLQNNDVVILYLTKSGNCINTPTVYSNKIPFVVRDTIKSSLKIAGSNLFCQGNSINFIANTQNRGPSPGFKWYVNGFIQSSIDSTFTSSSLKNNDQVWATIEPKLLCAIPSIVTSNKIQTTVKDTVRPEIAVTGPPYSCKGVLASFQAQVKNEGQTPVYRWFVNDIDERNNSAFWSSNKLQNGDKIYVKLQSDFQCAIPEFVLSPTYLAIVLDSIKPKITVEHDSVYCENTFITLKTKIENGGSKPTYTWIENDVVFDTASTISSQFPKGKHTIEVILNSNEKCAISRVGSNISFVVKDTITIYPVITGDTTVCEGSIGSYLLKNILPNNTLYNWIDTYNSPGNNNSVFSKSNLKNGEKIYLEISGNEKCVTYGKSNTLTVEVTPSLTPDINITASESIICPGETVDFKAVIKNGGSNENFAWKINGIDQNINSELFTASVTPSQDLVFNYKANLPCGPFAKDYSVPILKFKTGSPILTSISAPESYCAQDAAILFTTDQIDQVVYNWKIPSSLSASINLNTLYLSLKGNISKDSIKVSATNDCGTGNTVSILLNPKDCQQLFIPTGIVSSQEDGNNLWQIKRIESYEKANVMVFNRWGSKVFNSTGYKKPWDGTIQGKLLPAGTYYYVIEGINDKPITGALTIIH